MPSKLVVFTLLGCLAIASAAVLRHPIHVVYGAQNPAAPLEAVPHNLKVLPKDISAPELNRLMQQYQRSLGVPCGYCHAEAEGGKIDFASDENPMKELARSMMVMTRDINEKYLTQIGDRRYADPITCGNCHLGTPHPPAFEGKAK
ncbi:c-type cytochrome [Granulicella paludicola]|uniref:c-type cytochrome n=1 Tax=Granulicella paludicola TaxID=474951 RepID=UPI0021DF4485|nr:c-type cytochrome [Granulicella paludicola]